MEQDMLAGKLAEVDAQLAGVHAKLQSAAQMESTELNSAIAQTREETEQCARALAERLRHSRAHQVGEIADAFEEIRKIVRRVQTEVRRGDAAPLRGICDGLCHAGGAPCAACGARGHPG